MKQVFNNIYSGLLITALLLSSFAQGQTLTVNHKTAKSEKTESKLKTLSKYIENLSLTAGDESALSDELKDETEKVKAAFAAVNNKNGTIIVDRTGRKSRPVIEAVAAWMTTEKASKSLRGKQVLRLDLTALLGDAQNEAEAVALLKDVLASLESANSILVIEDVATLSRQNPLFGFAMANTLRQALANDKLHVVTAGTPESYVAEVLSDNGLARKFRKIVLDESDEIVGGDGFVGDRISPDLRAVLEKDPNKTVKVILQSDDINNKELRDVLSRHNVAIESRAESLNMLVLELPAKVAEAVAEVRGAKHLSLDKETKVLGHIETTTGLAAAKMQNRTSVFNGSGVGIAIVDSAIFDSHHTFVGNDGNKRVIETVDFVGDGLEDKYGHGTHVAALAAGRGGKPGDSSSEGLLRNYQGMAPEAKIISVKALKNDGTGTTAKLIEALNWIYTNRTRLNIRVVNLSLGTPAVETWRNDPICRAVRALTAAGVVVVAAAGNNGKNAQGNKIYGAIHAPGNDPSVITVGASNTFGTDPRYDDGVTTFSSRGPTRSFYTNSNGVKVFDHLIKPDLVAPGNKVVAAKAKLNQLATVNPELDVNYDGLSDDTQLMFMSGTSMATPIVSGTVALMLQVNPRLTPNMVKMILQYTAQPLAGFNSLEQGAGQLNVEGALRLAKLVRQNLPTPTPTGEPLLNTFGIPLHSSSVAGTRFQWAGGIFPNYGSLTGTDLITQYQGLYANGILYSDGILLSDGTLLSDGILLSDGLLVSDGILLSDGTVLEVGTRLSGYETLTRGTYIGSSSLLFSNTGTMTDRSPIADGLLTSDGLLVSDGILLSDSTMSQSGGVLVNGDNTASMR